MSKKPLFISIALAVAVIAFLAAAPMSKGQMRVQSKASHAEKLWRTSGHSHSEAEAFRHWDEDDPPEIPGSCATCHSTHGAASFFSTGGTGAVPTGTTIECEVCHTNPEQGTLRPVTDVTFPSGVTIEDLGPEAMCMTCHQGRSSGPSVDEYIAARINEGDDDDTENPSFSFRNIHYYAAAATQFGTLVDGGYQYAGKSYDGRFSHVTGYNACITCHNPHSLEVDIGGACQTCHAGVTDPKDIRYFGSFVDYDGDGDKQEGVYYEIEDLTSALYATIQAYAREVLAYPIVYDSATYPYFMNDLNDNGAVDANEAARENGYRHFSQKLLRAAYNYQVVLKDPAGYAHGGKYLIQLIYDSIEDMNASMTNPVISGLERGDEGHFDGSAEAWRHWDEDGEVSSSCARCHSAEGLAEFIATGTNVNPQHVANGMLCTTCHTSPPAVRRLDEVTFPSGAVETMGDSSNLCMSCHQGRASKFSVMRATSAPGPYTFINIHYFPTAAVLFGSEVSGGFEYPNMSYAGQNFYPNHMGRFDTCVECHMGTKSLSRDAGTASFDNHNVHKPNPADCVDCHGQDVSQPNPGADPAKFKFSGIRPAGFPDFDGDGSTSESLESEIKGLEEQLYERIQAYAAQKIGKPIIYDGGGYPYFFNDTNGNGAIDPGENTFPNRYADFNPKLLRAAYNFQMSKKEPHGFIHNPRYVAQLLVDSIVDLKGDATKFPWRY